MSSTFPITFKLLYIYALRNLTKRYFFHLPSKHLTFFIKLLFVNEHNVGYGLPFPKPALPSSLTNGRAQFERG